jgi:hypothetical protein
MRSSPDQKDVRVRRGSTAGAYVGEPTLRGYRARERRQVLGPGQPDEKPCDQPHGAESIVEKSSPVIMYFDIRDAFAHDLQDHEPNGQHDHAGTAAISPLIPHSCRRPVNHVTNCFMRPMYRMPEPVRRDHTCDRVGV